MSINEWLHKTIKIYTIISICFIMLPNHLQISKHTNLFYSPGLSSAVCLLRLPLSLLWVNRRHFHRPSISAPCRWLSCSPCFPHFLICLDGFSTFRLQSEVPFSRKSFIRKLVSLVWIVFIIIPFSCYYTLLIYFSIICLLCLVLNSGRTWRASLLLLLLQPLPELSWTQWWANKYWSKI